MKKTAVLFFRNLGFLAGYVAIVLLGALILLKGLKWLTSFGIFTAPIVGLISLVIGGTIVLTLWQKD
jgi:hypothetical protein